ncbi:MAG: cupin domain-containing protein, partial [Kiloniellales bacterium]
RCPQRHWTYSQRAVNRVKREVQVKKYSVRVAILVVVATFVVLKVAIADGLGSARPTLVEDKFGVPIDRQAVMLDWTSRGYSSPTVTLYPRGWERGEHAHPTNMLITLITGRMEFVIAGQRVVVEPGDELLYPARVGISARNLHDGTSRMLASWKR